ncbi:MAG TPA: hypothetical protein VHR64_07340 [Thermomicrobiales bacterium]|jgi:ABC-type lipoprotein release transport system permease subunit|nr:hypothetical protein [Thermomicrobiales bacterium]
MNDQNKSNSSIAVFLAGVAIGGVGGGIAGWLLGGHVAPLLTSLLNLIDRDSNKRTVNFEVLQQ